MSKNKHTPAALQNRLSELEERAGRNGIVVHYDLMEAAGIKLKGGICKIKGDYHLFIDKRKPISDKISILTEYLELPLPEDIPSITES